MEALYREATDETPRVVLDPAIGKFEFSAKSLPEDVSIFYDPIIDWLNEYAQAPNADSNFIFKMDYFNTASSKLILDIMLILDEIHEDGVKIKLEWHYREEDEDMMEAGEEYEDLIDVPMELIAF